MLSLSLRACGSWFRSKSYVYDRYDRLGKSVNNLLPSVSMNADEVELLPPRDVATRLNVSTRTLTRWANDGLIRVVILPSGQRRYYACDVAELVTP